MLYKRLLFTALMLSFALPAAAQTRVWTRLCGSTSGDEGMGVAVDGRGNVYVAGYTYGFFDAQSFAGGEDICLVKFDSSGIKLWTRLCGSDNIEEARGVAVDGYGNVYIAGLTFGSFDGQTNAGGLDICLIKYDSTGNKLWTRLCGTTGYDFGHGVAVDGYGYVYITGGTQGSLDGQTNAGGVDICVIKYDSGGNRLWTRLCGSTAEEQGHGIAVDKSGNVYVSGHTGSSIDGQAYAGRTDICLIKYDSGGNKLWTRLCGSARNEDGNAVAVDGGGNVYVAGDADSAFDGQPFAGLNDICLVKYDSGGNKLWTRICGTTEDEGARGVAADPSGNVYVNGFTEGIFQGVVKPGGHDIICIKYDGNGIRLSAPIFGSVGADCGWGATIDAEGNVYLTGNAGVSFDGQTSAGGGDIFLLKCSSELTKALRPVVFPEKRISSETDIQMFDIFGRKISGKDLSRCSAGIYLVRSKASDYCEVRMHVK